MFWDRRTTYSDIALAGADIASSAELRQKIAALDQLLAAKNAEIASLRAARESTKSVMRDYLELTAARDLLKGKLKVAAGVESTGRTIAPMPAARASSLPTAPAFPLEVEPALVPGTCYEGKVPNDRFLRGVQVGSDEPFTKGGHTIVRSEACSTGWMVLDPSRTVARSAAPGPVVRRRKVG